MRTGKIILSRKKKNFTAGFCILKETLPSLTKRLSSLHASELEYYNALKFDRRKLSYLLGRIAAKSAICEITERQDMEGFYIDFGIFQFPVVKNCAVRNMQVSISHCNDIGIAIAFPEEHPLGIDIEKVDEDKVEAIKSQICENELRLIEESNVPVAIGCTTIWTVKEGLSKIFRTGMTVDLSFFEVDTLEQSGSLWISTFSHCIQYKAISCYAGKYVCSVIVPKNTMARMEDFWEAFLNTAAQ